ncbi:hypothetical protein T12_14108 [Trichinella patagoniensis]|uniref:Uncharacterized protein n=1 Tax=Trichinella patagoniensis TaxID=990121 RepID=A0A0V0ZPN0_9BILA|nr:hypothetical protein T12_14108 [Trichinella patagoniensis]
MFVPPILEEQPNDVQFTIPTTTPDTSTACYGLLHFLPTNYIEIILHCIAAPSHIGRGGPSKTVVEEQASVIHELGPWFRNSRASDDRQKNN